MKPKVKNALAFLIVFAVAFGAVVARHLKEDAHTEKLDYTKALSSQLPVLMEFGRGTCVPCKAMMPILDELHADYTGKLAVGFIDTSKNPDLAEKYEIKQIPTQVFFDAEGKELFRHVGFYAKDDILSKWDELGVELETTQ